MGYHYNTSSSTYTTTTYTNDLTIITENIQHIISQITRLHKYVKCSHMDLNLSKCVITSCSNKFKLKPDTTFKAYIQSQNINFKSQNFPILTQNEPLIYLGLHMAPSFKWNLQKKNTLKEIKQQSQLLINLPANLTKNEDPKHSY